MNTKTRIVEGVSGSGNTKWMVITEDQYTGRWLWTENFNNKEEAELWLKSIAGPTHKIVATNPSIN